MLISIQAWPLLHGYSCKETKKSRRSEKWFKEEKCAGIIGKTHPQKTMYSVFCLICDRFIPVEHQGKADLEGHCTSKKYVDLLNSRRPITQLFVAVGSEVDRLVSDTEVKATGFLVEHNLSLATADHFRTIIQEHFSRCEDCKSVHLWKAKTSCILNRA